MKYDCNNNINSINNDIDVLLIMLTITRITILVEKSDTTFN
jgi:hypothetical protein